MNIKGVTLTIPKSEYEISDWQGKCKKETAEKWKKAAVILEYYGFYLEEEEKELLEGTHKLFAEEKEDGEKTP